MNNAKQLYVKRRQKDQKEKQYYNKFIFNGHFSVFLVILLGAFILGYGQWLRTIPTGINYSLIISIVLGLSSIFPLKTLLQKADELFLLPFEKQMRHYIQQSVYTSYFKRLPLQIVLLIIFYPLLNALHPNELFSFIVLVLLAFVLPFIGLQLRWQWFLFGLENASINLLLFIFYVSSYYVWLDGQSYMAMGSLVFIIILIYMFKSFNDKKHFPWELMLNQAKQHQSNYYKFVNMFTDVKGIEAPASRRKYLDVFLKKPKEFNQKGMYLYLFKRIFLRGKDAFHLTIRLFIIVAALMIWLHQPIISILIAVLGMYIIILQMSQFYTQEAYGLWPQVWPASELLVIKGYEQFLYRTVIIVGILFSLIYIIMNPTELYLVMFIFAVGIATVKSTIRKLKYQESLLKD